MRRDAQSPQVADEPETDVQDRQDQPETLQALDDLVAGVVDKLRDAGAMKNTYVFFTSDNGWQEAEHRIPEGKAWAYEQSISMPLLVGGPGVRAGSTARELTLNTDFFPTFGDLAGIRMARYVDGRSLRPILEGHNPARWRTADLLERRNPNPDQLESVYAGRSYHGIRTSSMMKYIEYVPGPRELTISTTSTTPWRSRRACLRGWVRSRGVPAMRAGRPRTGRSAQRGTSNRS